MIYLTIITQVMEQIVYIQDPIWPSQHIYMGTWPCVQIRKLKTQEGYLFKTPHLVTCGTGVWTQGFALEIQGPFPALHGHFHGGNDAAGNRKPSAAVREGCWKVGISGQRRDAGKWASVAAQVPRTH